ncbi:hypothetical protein B0H15DRAFT_1024920 [Mycena belliarum]|uniref:Uncharacterized protein n=1 Tax=Mycena belliarum TaxID=1033014 RepID=A0AAD6XMA4_9AGAR|nr:hypothetical protein B0H15DRAFT_1024920 [Mycena belliae]
MPEPQTSRRAIGRCGADRGHITASLHCRDHEALLSQRAWWLCLFRRSSSIKRGTQLALPHLLLPPPKHHSFPHSKSLPQPIPCLPPEPSRSSTSVRLSARSALELLSVMPRTEYSTILPPRSPFRVGRRASATRKSAVARWHARSAMWPFRWISWRRKHLRRILRSLGATGATPPPRAMPPLLNPLLRPLSTPATRTTPRPLPPPPPGVRPRPSSSARSPVPLSRNITAPSRPARARTSSSRRQARPRRTCGASSTRRTRTSRRVSSGSSR